MPSHVDWSRTLALLALAVGIPVLFVASLPLLVRPVIGLAVALGYRLRATGTEHLPKTGGALLAVNHVTWLDGFFVLAACPRKIKALVNADYVNMRVIRWLAGRVGIIPVPATGPRAQRVAIEAARRALDAGEILVIFPEAQLTRNGRTGAFLRGLEVIMSGRESVPVIPVFLGNLWGSRFSFGRNAESGVRRRWSRRVVSIAFGPPAGTPVTAFATRQAVIEASVKAREAIGSNSFPPPFDPDLPHWRHETFGLIAGSSPDVDQQGIRQTGQKPGTVGQSLPGVAIRAVNEAGAPLGFDAEGRLQVLLPGETWRDTGHLGKIDREGFITLTES
jgi:1-acyl-sn-glycerol-3-phosphate acyltransferase